MDMPHRTPHDASPAPCQRCGMAGATCCTIDPTDASLCFPVSRSEWERIVDHCDKRGGFATEPNTRPFVDNLIRLFPGEAREIERLFPPHGFHLRLAVDARGNCAFLGPEGCTLPREVRPWYCLVFPFWLQGGRIAIFTPSGCVAVREGRTVPGCLALMNLTARDVRRLTGRLRLAWGLPPLDENGETL